MVIKYIVLLVLALIEVVAADQSGYISIDCGISGDIANYADPITSINYTSDANFINTGSNHNISSIYKTNSLERQFLNLRSFPFGDRNCYTLKPISGKYLIRASFMYGNYDGESQLPKFDIHLGVEYWETIIFSNVSSQVRVEIIHTSLSDYINVCLVNTGNGVPFLSSLELRPLNKTVYTPREPHGSLKLYTRTNFNPIYNQAIRYKDDMFDRMWTPLTLLDSLTINTTKPFYNEPYTYRVPSTVMGTACTPKDPNANSLNFSWIGLNPTDNLYIYMHFAELQSLQMSQSRYYNIYINNDDFNYFGNIDPYSPHYLMLQTISSVV